MQDVAARRAFDRRLFFLAALLFPAIVLVGFGPTYYAKTWFGTPPLPSAWVHAHGLVMSLWVALFIVQVALISSRRVQLHQRMGYAGIVLGVLIVATGMPTALRAAKYGSASTPAGIPPLAFMLVPLFDLVMFVLLFAAAIYYRRQPDAHKGLMLLTAINFLPPAIARIPVAALQAFGPLWFFGAPTVVMLICLIADTRQRGRVNRVLLTGSILLIASYPARLLLMSTDGWMRAAAWAVSFV